mgnify:FL=1
MTKYKCKKCKNEIDLVKATIVIIEDKVVTKEALCECGEYMVSKPVEGMPSLIRTEPSLKK